LKKVLKSEVKFQRHTNRHKQIRMKNWMKKLIFFLELSSCK